METLGIFKHIGMTFAIGSSTFAMIFYYAAMWDGKISEDESHFMHIVYFVLRIGMIILIPLEIGLMIYAFYTGIDTYVGDHLNWFRLMLLGIISINAVLMTKHKMPMWLGPAFAGGSWYYYFFVSITTKTFAISTLFYIYAGWVIFLAITLGYLRKRLLSQRLN